MKRKIIYLVPKLTLLLWGLLVMPALFTACDDDDDHGSAPMTITAVYLEDAQS